MRTGRNFANVPSQHKKTNKQKQKKSIVNNSLADYPYLHYQNEFWSLYELGFLLLFAVFVCCLCHCRLIHLLARTIHRHQTSFFSASTKKPKKKNIVSTHYIIYRYSHTCLQTNMPHTHTIFWYEHERVVQPESYKCI